MFIFYQMNLQIQSIQFKMLDNLNTREYQTIDQSKIQLLPLKNKSITLSEEEEYLRDILINKVLFQDIPLDQNIFESDLVIKIKVPDEIYVEKKERIELGTLIMKPSKALYAAYTAAFEELQKSMEETGDDIFQTGEEENSQVQKQLLLRNSTSFKYFKNLPQRQRSAKINNQDEKVRFNMIEQYLGIIDSFIIQLNTLIYVLQHDCGFVVNTFMNTEFVDLPLGDIKRQQAIEKYTQIIENTKGQLRKNLFFILSDKLREIGQQVKVNQQKIIQSSQPNRRIKRYLYLLLHLPEENLLKAANNFQIKKQIDYVQLDPFINQPMDDRKRPLRYHSKFNPQKKSQEQNENELIDIKKRQETYHEEYPWQLKLQERKCIERKLDFRVKPYVEIAAIQNESELNKKQIKKYEQFTTRLLKSFRSMQITDLDQENLRHSEEEYLKFLNRGKLHDGIKKVYLKFQKQKQYIQKLQEVSHQLGYKTFQYPTMFAEFGIAPKTKGFYDRFRDILLYKEFRVGPYGQRKLFNKMERIKLAYLMLKDHIRISNLKLIKADLFALNDDFEKYGAYGDPSKALSQYYSYYLEEENEKSIELKKKYEQENEKILSKIEENIKKMVQINGDITTLLEDNKSMRQQVNLNKKRIFQCPEKIQGGLYGTTLYSAWPKFLFFLTDFKVIRSYLGEVQAYQIFIKIQLLELFSILSIFGIAGELIKHFLLQKYRDDHDHFPQSIFYLSYIFLAVVIYSGFISIFTYRENLFLKNYEETNLHRYFRLEYKGPYIRNIVNDNLNDYSLDQLSLFDKIKSFFFLVLVGGLIGLEIGFYYLIRYAILQFSLIIEEFDRSIFYLLYPAHFIGYGIFFLVNQVFTRALMEPFFEWLTEFENWPSQDGFDRSVNRKIYLFLIATELIAPIDLVYIQYAQKQFCSSQCLKEHQAYSYARYFAYFLIILLKILRVVARICKRKQKKTIPSEAKTNSFQTRLDCYLKFIQKQSKKPNPDKVQFSDETLALLDFCNFLVIFPLGTFLSFILLFFEYDVQRKQLMVNSRRPISKSERIERYSTMIKSIFHWMIFFNLSQMIIVFEWLEYLFQDVILLITEPNFYSMMLLRYLVIIVLTVIYEIIGRIVKWIVNSFLNSMERRKLRVYEKFIETRDRKKFVTKKLPKPLTTIARTYNGDRDGGNAEREFPMKKLTKKRKPSLSLSSSSSLIINEKA